MRRAVIFSTLALLLLAAAGVTVAQEGAFDADAPAESTGATVGGENTPSVEATGPEATTPGETVPEETSDDVEAPSVEDEGRDEPTAKPGGKPEGAPGASLPKKPGAEDRPLMVSGTKASHRSASTWIRTTFCPWGIPGTGIQPSLRSPRRSERNA